MTKKYARKVAVVGLGYVGLPVAVAFGNIRRVIGFDVNPRRLEDLRRGHDANNEASAEELAHADILYTDRPEDLRAADFFIVTVPTPVDEARRPDLGPMLRATETLGKILKKGDVVVYESTVYPGVTEEECLPILERLSGLRGGRDFKVGYSPERINPGDPEHRFETILKIVSGMDAEALDIVAGVYASVVKAGVHRTGTIKVAEAAKVIENTQRDLNIALMNELAIVFDKMGIPTREVLEAAGTKWNFLKFTPGLVGGHCIGVDPYYLTHKSEMLGYRPQVILAGRRINDGMGKFIARKTVKEMIHAGRNVLGARVTVLGLTFKENCPDIRNSKTVDILAELRDFGAVPQVSDPFADAEDARREYGIELTPMERLAPAAAVIVAVAHKAYREFPAETLKSFGDGNTVVIDVKNIYDAAVLRHAGLLVWQL